MLTFTGERVIPGAVEPDLWNEHVSRYYFAREFAANRRVLDLGCGTGYGTDLMASAAKRAMGVDLSPEAIRYARAHAENQALFCVASAEAVPVPDSSFDLITAFEVIEHLPGWQALLLETSRILTDTGIFLVSTPNKTYYEESRQNAGPNPFHVHEFEREEFQAALQKEFPYVQLFSQNHQQVIAFAGEHRSGALSGFLSSPPAFADAHFFLAICSRAPLEVPAYVYASSSGNLLKDRETHIHLLKQELKSSREAVEAYKAEAERRKQELDACRTAYAQRDGELNSVKTQLAATQAERSTTQAELSVTREQLNRLTLERQLIAQSKWMRMGRRVGLGPQL